MKSIPPEPRPSSDILAEVERVIPSVARTVGELPEEQKSRFLDEYERRMNRRRTWDPVDEDERRQTAAAFSLEFATRDTVGRNTTNPPKTTSVKRDLRCFSLSLARELSPADALVYRYIQKTQAKLTDEYTPKYNEREGRRWLPGYSAKHVHGELKCFQNEQTVTDAINRLQKAGFIMTQRTGAFVPLGRRTGRKRDIAMWIHAPAPFDPNEVSVCVNAAQAQQHGLSVAMMITLFETNPETKRLPATQLAKLLPLTAETIRKLRKKMP